MAWIKMKKTSAGPAGVFENDKKYNVDTKTAMFLIGCNAAIRVKDDQEVEQIVDNIKEEKQELTDNNILELAGGKHKGQGYYIFPDGNSIRGKKNAVEYAENILNKTPDKEDE